MQLVKRDSRGLVGQPDIYFPDGIEGGDSLNWTAHYLYLKESDFRNEKYEYLPDTHLLNEYINHFESKEYPGLYVRHPNPWQSKHGFASYCEGNWKGVESRDQKTGKLCLFVKAKAKKELKRCLIQHLKRGMIFANNTIHNGDDPTDYDKDYAYRNSTKLKRHKLPDITGPDVWALYIRGFRAYWLYPLLCVFDLHLLIGAISVGFSKDTDIISHVLKVITARDVMPTPFGWLASKVSTALDINIKLQKYWSGWRRQPGMYELYVPKVKEYWRSA